MKKCFSPSRLLFCLFFLVGSQATPAQFRFDHWSADNGLPQNSIRDIVQTRDGYLWLATHDGLVRFDGVRFTVFNRSNSPGIITNRFISLYEDTQGDLWATAEVTGLTALSSRPTAIRRPTSLSAREKVSQQTITVRDKEAARRFISRQAVIRIIQLDDAPRCAIVEIDASQAAPALQVRVEVHEFTSQQSQLLSPPEKPGKPVELHGRIQSIKQPLFDIN
jgi:ligand-binding sensor domain-containing protein